MNALKWISGIVLFFIFTLVMGLFNIALYSVGVGAFVYLAINAFMTSSFFLGGLYSALALFFLRRLLLIGIKFNKKQTSK